MDLLLICNQAQESSVIGDALLAMSAREQGESVAILFTGEALAALAGGTFDWPPLLRDRQTRVTIAKAAARQNIPMVSRRDARQTDITQLLQAAKEKGAVLLACPFWSKLLDVEGRVPSYLEVVGEHELLAIMQDSRTVLGGM